MKAHRSGQDGAPRTSEDLLGLAAETRALVDRLDANVRANPERLSVSMFNNAIVAGLRNQAAILEVLAAVLASRGGAAPPVVPPLAEGSGAAQETPDEARPGAAADAAAALETLEDVVAQAIAVVEAAALQAPPVGPPPRREGELHGTGAREAVIDFDHRDRVFEKGLEKLNAWLSTGRVGLPFQKRDGHAYLNAEAMTEPMRAKIESELMGREGYGRRLGKLVIEGLEGEVVIYAKLREGGASTEMSA